VLFVLTLLRVPNLKRRYGTVPANESAYDHARHYYAAIMPVLSDTSRRRVILTTEILISSLSVLLLGELVPSTTSKERPISAIEIRLAERLLDLKTANMVIGEILRASDEVTLIPILTPISLAYATALKDSPLRNLSQDFFIYDSAIDCDECIQSSGVSSECVHDITVEMLRILRTGGHFNHEFISLESVDMCRYHPHDENHLEMRALKTEDLA
jgi:hypothetical protein